MDPLLLVDGVGQRFLSEEQFMRAIRVGRGADEVDAMKARAMIGKSRRSNQESLQGTLVVRSALIAR
jgi:hypothetical protein